mgnify:CR=1 FL=1
MRKHLLETFDKIYILDLHGSSKKEEKSLDGSQDQNVFDIMQGVSINVFIKTSNKKALATIFHFDSFGKRDDKYTFLNMNSINSIDWVNLDFREPYFFFVPKDFSQAREYNKYFNLSALVPKYVSGFQTKRDKVTIQIKQDDLDTIYKFFTESEIEKTRNFLDLPPDGRDWKVEWAKNDLLNNHPRKLKVMYRPFDYRYTYFTGKSKGFVAYPREEMINHLQKEDNVSLITCRQQSTFDFQHVFTSRLISDMCNISSQTKETGYIFPLYLYQDKAEQENLEGVLNRTPNLNQKIVNQISDKLDLTFTNEKDVSTSSTTDTNFAPIDILDYIYAVLHSPTYREKYKEFLKIDFPRVPYPKDKETFWKLVKLGGEIRELHLLESPKVNEAITSYPIGGDNTITRKLNKNDWELFDVENQLGRIWINSTLIIFLY